MKKALTLLAVTMLTATSAGCNCCPCLRNLCPFGACSSVAPAPVATYAAVPACAPVCAPACGPAPVYAAAPAMPMYAAPQQYTVPQYAAPQYTMQTPQPVYSEAGCGASYAAETSCGMGYSVADPAPCGCTEVGYGEAPQMQQMMVDPGPAQ